MKERDMTKLQAGGKKKTSVHPGDDHGPCASGEQARLLYRCGPGRSAVAEGLHSENMVGGVGIRCNAAEVAEGGGGGVIF
jgi:hypothetical protein